MMRILPEQPSVLVFPGICFVVNKEKSNNGRWSGPFAFNPVNAAVPRIPYLWLVFNEKVKVDTVFLWDSAGVSDSVLLYSEEHLEDGHLKMLGGYLEFFMKPALADTYLSLKREIKDLIQKKLLDSNFGMLAQKELLMAIKLLFQRTNVRVALNLVTNCQHPQRKKRELPGKLSRNGAGGTDDNAKNELQTLLVREGHGPPTYKAKQLKNNKFCATVNFNGLDFMGQPCSNKKLAEKDASAQALLWLGMRPIQLPEILTTCQ